MQKDENLNGKFKISVVSTGIDNENYYRSISKMKITYIFQHIETEPNLKQNNDFFEDNPNIEGLEKNKQTSFFVDLQETAKNNQIQKKKLINEENKVKTKKKRSLFAKIFGLKDKEENNKVNIQEVKTEESSEVEFKKEMREVIEENLKTIRIRKIKICRKTILKIMMLLFQN